MIKLGVTKEEGATETAFEEAFSWNIFKSSRLEVFYKKGSIFLHLQRRTEQQKQHSKKHSSEIFSKVVAWRYSMKKVVFYNIIGRYKSLITKKMAGVLKSSKKPLRIIVKIYFRDRDNHF